MALEKLGFIALTGGFVLKFAKLGLLALAGAGLAVKRLLRKRPCVDQAGNAAMKLLILAPAGLKMGKITLTAGSMII